MNLYNLSDTIVFKILRDIDFGYLEIINFDGTILKFCANEGDTVPVGSLIALYGESGTSEEVINELHTALNEYITMER